MSTLDSHNCIRDPWGGVALNRLSMQRRVLESRHWPFWAVLGAEAWVRRFCPARVWRTLFEVVHPVWVPHRPTWHGPHWALRLEQKLSLVTALLSRKAVSLPAEKLLAVPAFRSSALPSPAAWGRRGRSRTPLENSHPPSRHMASERSVWILRKQEAGSPAIQAGRLETVTIRPCAIPCCPGEIVEGSQGLNPEPGLEVPPVSFAS